ncbi:hypothetical protein BDR26DRAFT_869414 [Obelidium mucronatum]|nr:hypothetical protein BDR26DRAFT_869414 [Obelidium mucronatum]
MLPSKSKTAVRMVKSTSALRSPLSSSSAPAVSVTRKSAYQYGSSSDTSASNLRNQDESDAPIDPALARPTNSTTNTLPQHFTSTSQSKQSPRKIVISQLKLWRRLFSNQPLVNKVLWVGVLFTSVSQLLGMFIYLRSHLLISPAKWPNSLYQTDALSPLISVVHAILSIAFTTVLAPYLFHLHTNWHHIYPHAHETTSLIPLNIFWMCVPVLALSSIAPSVTDLIYAHGAIAQVPRIIMFASTISGAGFVYCIRIMGKQIIIATVSDGSSGSRRAVKRRSSNFSLNNIIPPSHVAAVNGTSSSTIAAASAVIPTSGSYSRSTQSIESSNRTWIKKLATSFESHVGVLGLIASGWNLGLLEFIYHTPPTPDPTGALLTDSANAATQLSATISSKAFLLPLFIILFQTAVSFSLIYWGACSHGIRVLPPKNQQINLTTFNQSRSSSGTSLHNIASYAGDTDESIVPLLSQDQVQHQRQASGGSFHQQQQLHRQESNNASGSGGGNGGGGVSNSSGTGGGGYFFRSDSNEPSEQSGYTTPSIPGTPQHNDTNHEDFASNLADAVNNMIKKRAGSNSLRNAYSNPSIRTSFSSSNGGGIVRKRASMNQVSAMEAVARFERMAVASVVVVGCCVAGLLVGWILVCRASCGRK